MRSERGIGLVRSGRALLLFAAVVAGCYAPVVFAGKSLQGPLYTVSPILPGGPWNYEGRRPANTFDVDIATPAFYEWPLDHFIGGVLRRGELPLWNPHQGTGIPLVTNYSTRVFFPFQALLNLSPVTLWDFFFLLRLWIAGTFTYLFLLAPGSRGPPPRSARSPTCCRGRSSGSSISSSTSTPP